MPSNCVNKGSQYIQAVYSAGMETVFGSLMALRNLKHWPG